MSLLVSTIVITIEHADVGIYPGCGFVVIGEDQYIGQEINQPQSGLLGFLTADHFKIDGSTFSYPNEEVISLEVRVPTSEINKIQRIISSIRTRATLFEGVDNLYDPFTTLGVIQTFDLTLKGSRWSECNFQIEGIK